MNRRFSFPNSELCSVKDTSTHEVEVIMIEEDGNVFVIEMIRRAGLYFEGEFLVASINDNRGNNLWKFAGANHTGLGLLASTPDGVVIALCGAGKLASVERVIPLMSIVKHEQSDLAVLVRMKRGAADYLRRGYKLTHLESKMFKVTEERRKAAEEAAQAAAEAERRRVREERVNAILARPILETTAAGKCLHGVPVVSAEWPMLPDGTRVILVSGINDGQIGKMLEAFVVRKVPGRNPRQEYVTKLGGWSDTASVSAAQAVSQPLCTVLAEREGSFHEVQIYPSMEDIRQARNEGLNSGTLVAVSSEDGKTIEVFSVRTSEVITLGKFSLV